MHLFLAPVKRNQVSISIILRPQKWYRPFAVRLGMTKCSELKRCVTKIAPLWTGCGRSNAPMCHVADCAFRGAAYYSETEPTQKPAFFLVKAPIKGNGLPTPMRPVTCMVAFAC